MGRVERTRRPRRTELVGGECRGDAAEVSEGTPALGTVCESSPKYEGETGKERTRPLRAEIVRVREVALRYVGPRRCAQRIEGPEDAVELARRCIRDDTKEHVIAIYLDSSHIPIGVAVVSIGTATMSLAHPREVFQPAIHVGAVALVLLHNHPSGNTKPSAEDREITRQLCGAGQLLGVKVLDHVVFERCGSFVSLQAEEGAPFFVE